MKKLLSVAALILVALQAHASVSFDKLITPWQSTTSGASASFTPTASGEAIIGVAFDENTNQGEQITFSGTGTYTEHVSMQATTANFPGNQRYYFSNNANMTGGVWANLAGSSGSQTLTAATAGTGDPVLAFGAVYAGVVNMQSLFAQFYSTTQTTITGSPVYVPSGAILVGVIVDWNGNGSDTITVSGGGTSRGSGNAAGAGYAYNWSEWSGSGGSITPTWTVATDGDNYFIWEFLLAPSGKIIAVDAAQSTGEGTINGQTIALNTPVAVGDVIAVEIAGSLSSSSSPFPITVTDNAGSGSYTVANAQYETTTSLYQFGAVYYKTVTTAQASPVITFANSDGAASSGYGSAVHLVGFAGTATTDASAAVDNIITTSQTTQTLNISTSQNNEIIIIAPWSNDYINANPTGYIGFPSPTSDAYDAGFYVLTYTNPGAVNFSGTLDLSSQSFTVGGGIYDNTSSSCTNSGYTSGGAIATPNGSSGSYLGNAGGFVTPNCSSIQYWQPSGGKFGTNMLIPMAPLAWLIARRNRLKGRK